MRPRVGPAEDILDGAGAIYDYVEGFNEAAGRTRGRHRLEKPSGGNQQASMRPRVGPAEDSSAPTAYLSCSPGFNEAAGRTRGRHINGGTAINIDDSLQ